jgi:hypothetical protein
MNYLNNEERLDLKKLINENRDCENNTDDIRRLKHSTQIQKGINDLVELKKAHPGLSNEEFAEFAKSECVFLYENYIDIFMKIIKDELNMDMMQKLIYIFKMIEDEKVDQHSASVLVGKYLKEIYVDSAIRRGNHLDELHAKDAKPEPTDGRNISWKEYKTQNIKITKKPKKK